MRIVAENLGKRFNREWIFKNMSQTFESGNTYAIVGPNGSGKSTFLNVLWGQMPPSLGQLTYSKEGYPVPTEDIFKHVAIAAPYMELIDEFTLEEMVKFHFKFKKLRPEIQGHEIYDLMELGHAKTKIISQFSSGMKQRLKLALAFFGQAEVLFLDEPTTNLDKNANVWYLKNLESARNKLVFIASNQESEYPENSRKINIMDYKAGLQVPDRFH
jgi:ABC-type multidrug transport system ATPase subunit